MFIRITKKVHKDHIVCFFFFFLKKETHAGDVRRCFDIWRATDVTD